MPPWDGEIRKTHSLYDKGKWLEYPRCTAITLGSGAGYPGAHQCSFSVVAVYNGAPLCACHIRQRVNAKEKPPVEIALHGDGK